MIPHLEPCGKLDLRLLEPFHRDPDIPEHRPRTFIDEVREFIAYHPGCKLKEISEAFRSESYQKVSGAITNAIKRGDIRHEGIRPYYTYWPIQKD